MLKAWTSTCTICLILLGCRDEQSVINPERPKSGTPIQVEQTPSEGTTYRVIRAQPSIQRRCQDLNDRRRQMFSLKSILRDQWNIHLVQEQMPRAKTLQFSNNEESEKVRAMLETFEQLANKTIEDCLQFLSLEEALQWREESRIASRASFHLTTIQTLDLIEQLEAELKEVYGLTIVFLPNDSYRFHIVDQWAAQNNGRTPFNSLGILFQLTFYLQQILGEQEALAKNFATAEYFGKKAPLLKGEIYPAKMKLRLVDELVSFMLNLTYLPTDVAELICLFEESAK